MPTTYRIYADDSVVHEDDFHLYDEGGEVPFYDDYSTHVVPDDDKDAEHWDIPEPLRNYIIEQRDETTMKIDPSKLTIMLEKQDGFNRQVHEDWLERNLAWHRAIWVECGEMLDHYGWKWWKKQEPNMHQVRLEIVDIWHFVLGMTLNDIFHATDKTIDRPTLIKIARERILDKTATRAFYVSDINIRDIIDEFASHIAKKDMRFDLFCSIMYCLDMSFDDLYKWYIGKNVLNKFRQDRGYSDGTYQKIWDGKEDNEHLAGIMSDVHSDMEGLESFIYDKLNRAYNTSCGSFIPIGYA